MFGPRLTVKYPANGRGHRTTEECQLAHGFLHAKVMPLQQTTKDCTGTDGEVMFQGTKHDRSIMMH